MPPWTPSSPRRRGLPNSSTIRSSVRGNGSNGRSRRSSSASVRPRPRGLWHSIASGRKARPTRVRIWPGRRSAVSLPSRGRSRRPVRPGRSRCWRRFSPRKSGRWNHSSSGRSHTGPQSISGASTGLRLMSRSSITTACSRISPWHVRHSGVPGLASRASAAAEGSRSRPRCGWPWRRF